MTWRGEALPSTPLHPRPYRSIGLISVSLASGDAYWAQSIAPLQDFKERPEATVKQRYMFYTVIKMDNNINIPAEQRVVQWERYQEGVYE